MVVMASWPERAGALLASRWVGRIEPAEFDVLAEKAEPLGMGAIKLLLVVNAAKVVSQQSAVGRCDAAQCGKAESEIAVARCSSRQIAASCGR